jgi:type IV pilus assembly protein PilY1
MKMTIQKAIISSVAALVCLGSSHAGNLTLSETPLFLIAAVDPNVYFLLDDSGSMDWEVLIEDERSGGRGDYNDNGIGGDGVAYIFSNSTNLYTSSAYKRVEDEEQDPGYRYWRFKSPDYNAMYYSPAVTYKPWPGTDAGGSPLYADAPATAAALDPEDSGDGTFNLISTTGPYYPAKYYRWTDVDADGVPDASGEYSLVEIKASVSTYTGEGRGARTDCAGSATSTCSYAEEIQNFANWFTYYRKRSYVAWGSIGSVIADSVSIRTGLYRFNDGLFEDGGQSVFELENSTDKQTVLEELYCRTGSYCAGANGTPARRGLAGLGQFFAGTSSPILPSASGGKCQQNFNITMTDGYWNGGNPVGFGNEDGDDDTDFDGGVYGDTQSNLLADVAMYYYENDLKPSIADEVPLITGVDEAPHQHLVTYGVAFGVVGTLDPFDTKTPGDLTDTDPAATGFSWATVSSNTDTTVDDLWHAAYNGRGVFLSAKNPTELTAALGSALGSIADRTSSSSSVALSSGFLNSGSLLFQARFDSSDWSGQLLAYSITSSGTDIGSLGSMPEWDAGCVLTGGSCTTPTVKTSYPGQHWETGREILTYKPSIQKGIPFLWPVTPSSPSATELDTAQVDAIRRNPVTGLADTLAVGASRISFLRGLAVPGMRSRSSVLGDVINSNPVFVASPAAGYKDSFESAPYSAFSYANRNRTPMLYVGANDGMLHGFEASKDPVSGGIERIAYVPAEVFENLSVLTSPLYGGSISHRTFVDASATAADVFYDGSWKTVLVGGLGKGGQGVYALNVTDPSNFDEGNAASLVLWEFTDADDADLGFTYSQPAIVRMHNGRWAAVVGNGYNNTDSRGGADTDVSSSGNGVLYIVDIEDGSLIKKLDTGVGTADDPTGAARPNGLATPSPVDLDGDRIVDLIYVPDLFGNVWKIDVTDSSASNWDFAYKSGINPEAFFVAKNASGVAQPITTKLEVGLHPTLSGQMVYLGTGKYIETGDNSAIGQPTQVFYGIWDRNEPSGSLSVIERTHLLEQAILEEEVKTFDSNTSEIRITSEIPIVWHLATGLPVPTAGKLGWYMDLYNQEGGNTNNYGERVVSDPVLRDGKIIFVTLLPLSDPCDFGGDSWFMELAADSGARLLTSPVDLNGDAVFSTADWTTDASGNDAVVSGVKSKVGILPAPGILKDNTAVAGGGGREFKYFSGSSGAIQSVTESRNNVAVGRQSWREVLDK